jgi:hypothetical protein
VLKDMTEANRRAIAKALDWEGKRLDNPAVVAAAVGIAGGRAKAARYLDNYYDEHYVLDEGIPPAAYEAIAGVLADRNPPWLAALVESRLPFRITRSKVNDWRLARWLVRLGAIDPPPIREYTAGMVRTLWLARIPLETALMQDPGLIDHEVWRLFTDLAVGPDAIGEKWANALVSLARQDKLDRSRLLDATLDAFLGDFSQRDLVWYGAFHDRLAPSLGQRAARSGKYLALLATAGKSGVTLGQRESLALAEAGVVGPDELLAASGPPLAFPQKAVATAQLKLIGKLMAAHPEARDQALVTAAQAFSHQREDVQAAALKLIARHGLPADAAARSAIAALAAVLSPALLPEARALGLVPQAEPVMAAPSVPVATSAPVVPRVVPVTESAELVQLLAMLIEDASDALAVERALAGAVRLAGLPIAERARLAGPLLRRVGPGHPDPFGSGDVAGLARAWGVGQIPAEPGGTWQSREFTLSSGILSARIREACQFIVGGAGLLLAEPEFADGSISHGCLLDRLRQRASLPEAGALGRLDLEQALLRLAPGAGDAFWAQWASLPAMPGLLLAGPARRAYEESFRPIEFTVAADGPLMPSVVACRVTPLAETATSAGVTSWCWSLLADIPTTNRDQWNRNMIWHVGGRIDEVAAGLPLLCPNNPELIAAHLLGPLSRGLEGSRSGALPALRGLASPGREFGRIGHLAMVTGLASAEASTRIAAAEVWARVSSDGRLAPDLAALAVTDGVADYAFKLTRLADGLRPLAADPATAVGVARACVVATVALLDSKPARLRPQGLHLLLELAARAGAVSVVPELPASITGLAAASARTKLAEAARRLIRLQ